MVVVTETPAAVAAGVVRGRQTELAGAVGVEQVRLEHAVAHQHRPPGRQPLAVEGARPERRRDQCVVHDRDGRAPRSSCRAGRAGTRRGDRGSGRWPRRRSSARGSPRSPGRTPPGTSTDFIFLAPSRRSARAAAFRPTASGSSSWARLRAARVPVVALHLAVRRRDRRHADAEARRRVAVSEAVRRRIGVAGVAVGILGALRVGHARIARERRRLGPARDLDLLLGRQVRRRHPRGRGRAPARSRSTGPAARREDPPR